MSVLVKGMDMPKSCAAIIALKAQNATGDTISRQAAIDVVKHAWAKGLEPSQYIEIISPAEVEPVRRGRWINDKGLYRCSECNELWTHWWANVVPIERMNKMMKYCPNCGARMTEGSEDEHTD